MHGAHRVCVVVAPENRAVWKDSLRDRVDMAGKVHGAELSAVVQQKPVCGHVGGLDLCHVAADNVAVRPNPAGEGRARVRHVDRLKLTATEPEAVLSPSRVGVRADDFSFSIDPLSVGQDGTRKIDRDKRQRSARGSACRGHRRQTKSRDGAAATDS